MFIHKFIKRLIVKLYNLEYPIELPYYLFKGDTFIMEAGGKLTSDISYMRSIEYVAKEDIYVTNWHTTGTWKGGGD